MVKVCKKVRLVSRNKNVVKSCGYFSQLWARRHLDKIYLEQLFREASRKGMLTRMHNLRSAQPKLDVNACGPDGKNAAHIAAKYGHFEVFKYLLKVMNPYAYQAKRDNNQHSVSDYAEKADTIYLEGEGVAKPLSESYVNALAMQCKSPFALSRDDMLGVRVFAARDMQPAEIFIYSTVLMQTKDSFSAPHPYAICSNQYEGFAWAQDKEMQLQECISGFPNSILDEKQFACTVKVPEGVAKGEELVRFYHCGLLNFQFVGVDKVQPWLEAMRTKTRASALDQERFRCLYFWRAVLELRVRSSYPCLGSVPDIVKYIKMLNQIPIFKGYIYDVIRQSYDIQTQGIEVKIIMHKFAMELQEDKQRVSQEEDENAGTCMPRPS